MTASGPPPPAPTSRWPGEVADLAQVLTILEDFLLDADEHVLDELARYPLSRPVDPASWAGWVAHLLGEHAATLRALTTPHRIGEP